MEECSEIEFTLNGKSVRAQGISPNMTLLEFLRDSGLTGSKEGCAEGDCGACSVAILDRDSQGRTAYRAINSCLVPLPLLAGREVVTVEGVSSRSGLHPVQDAMVNCLGSQCGYCTPGFILSLFEGYYRDDLKTTRQLEEQLCGNLCRCTGYRPIMDAASVAFARRTTGNGDDAFAARVGLSASPLGAVDFSSGGEKFFRPDSLLSLLKLMREHPNARLVAGATELGLEITKRYRRFPVLISLEAVKELREVSATPDEWRVGAALTLTECDDALGAEYPALREMLLVFGSRQIRNRATLGGNLATASPIGDSAPVLLSLDARLVLSSLPDPARNGDDHSFSERIVPVNEFFVAYRKTALQPGEVVRAILIPRGPSAGGLTRHTGWYKVSKRREMDISTVAAAFVVDIDSGGVVRHARLAYGGVAAMPARARKSEAALIERPWNPETLGDILPILRDEFTPISDVRGSAPYRLGLISSLMERFFEQTSSNATGAVLDSSEVSSPGSLPSETPHESAHKHVTGEALYTDDMTSAKGMLETWPVCSPHAHARILRRDASAALGMPGVHAVLLAEDIPGLNDVGAVKKDEILLADREVFFHGHPVALVVGDTQAACRAAAEKVIVEYEPLPAILSLSDAIEKGSFHNDPNFIRRGDADAALKSAPLTFEGGFAFGGQEHFYLETHAAWAEPGEDGSVRIHSSTQHPSEIQAAVAHVLHLPANKVVVHSPRMGGGFGGKETQGNTPAALAALAAICTRRPVRARLNRDQDMMMTGHRHPFLARFHVAHDAQGMLLALKAQLYSNGGWALDLSQAVTDRALFHLDNCYFIPSVECRGQVARTHLSSNTAFRGFGGPQGMLVIEEIMDRIARRLGLPPEKVREQNLYRGRGPTNTTHFGQEIEDNRINAIWSQLAKSSDFANRRTELARWNAAHPHRKRGIAVTPVKFGISFTVTFLNQAGALILIYQDGTVQVNHGGTEMGQGIHTNVRAIVSREFGIPLAQIRVMDTSTDKVPNTSATAASSGTDLNGAAVKNACDILRERLMPVAATLLGNKSGGDPWTQNLAFEDGKIVERSHPGVSVSFAELVQAAYFERISLSTTGYYRTPDIHWDRAQGRGKPFHYFACGAAVTEVEVDGFTGMMQILRADILHDVGDSINAGVNRGQVEGGFVQGAGWLTCEELLWDDQGRLLTHSPDTYKIPSIGDRPKIFNVAFLQNATQESVIHGSKAVGEPPLMLAISVREAIRDAIAAFGEPGGEIPLASPATSEAIFTAIQHRLKNPDSAPGEQKREEIAKILQGQ